MMKQIKIQDLLPLLKPGFVAMDRNGEWFWYNKKPHANTVYWSAARVTNSVSMELSGFDIAPYDGDWKDSLMECGK